MQRKIFSNYRLFIWGLLVLAVLMGSVFLIVAYTYKLQKRTEAYIDLARSSVNEAKEMENELTAIKGLTFTYFVNKSDTWLDSLRKRHFIFIYHLERARKRSNSPEDELLMQQISALFSNHEQNIHKAVASFEAGELQRANALLIHSAQDLLPTIQVKSNEFITINRRSELQHQNDLARTNQIILVILTSLGIGGIAAGLLIGWMLSRFLFGPINQLVLQVRGAEGEAVLEKVQLVPGTELDELGERITGLIDRVNRANEDLLRSKELLQHSNKFASLGKIAPTIAHEIRNPLAAIKMLVYSIREENGVPQSVIDDLNIISNEIDRMENFTKDFLMFAKPSDPVFAVIDPSQYLGEVLQLLKPKLRKNSIAVEENFSKEKFMVNADAGHLKQVFMNILMNAIDVMPNGGTLTIEVIRTAIAVSEGETNEFMAFNFTDTGPGIPEAILKSIFEPYIKGSDRGVGIGMAISQGIAQTHGGWIEAENLSPKGGARFKFFLPLIKT